MINVVSLFDGISGARIAIEHCGIGIDKVKVLKKEIKTLQLKSWKEIL